MLEAPQLRQLHVPVTAAPAGVHGASRPDRDSQWLIATLLGATHLRRLTLDLYATVAHDAHEHSLRCDFPDVSAPVDFLAHFAPLFPHLPAVHAYFWCSPEWLQPRLGPPSGCSLSQPLRPS